MPFFYILFSKCFNFKKNSQEEDIGDTENLSDVSLRDELQNATSLSEEGLVGESQIDNSLDEEGFYLSMRIAGRIDFGRSFWRQNFTAETGSDTAMESDPEDASSSIFLSTIDQDGNVQRLGRTFTRRNTAPF